MYLGKPLKKHTRFQALTRTNRRYTSNASGVIAGWTDWYKPVVAPDILERVVAEIDAVVMGSRFTRWQTSRERERTVKTEIRKALKKFGLPATGDLSNGHTTTWQRTINSY